MLKHELPSVVLAILSIFEVGASPLVEQIPRAQTPCDSLPCGPHGDCTIDGMYAFFCDCQPGWGSDTATHPQPNCKLPLQSTGESDENMTHQQAGNRERASSKSPDSSPTTVFGMSVVVFLLVSAGVLTFGGLLIYFLCCKSRGPPTTRNARRFAEKAKVIKRKFEGRQYERVRNDPLDQDEEDDDFSQMLDTCLSPDAGRDEGNFRHDRHRALKPRKTAVDVTKRLYPMKQNDKSVIRPPKKELKMKKSDKSHATSKISKLSSLKHRKKGMESPKAPSMKMKNVFSKRTKLADSAKAPKKKFGFSKFKSGKVKKAKITSGKSKLGGKLGKSKMKMGKMKGGGGFGKFGTQQMGGGIMGFEGQKWGGPLRKGGGGISAGLL